MSDDTWQAIDLVAPKDRAAVPFAPWFPEPKAAASAPVFNHWDLKRDAALERERVAAEARAQADAEARAQAIADADHPDAAVVHTQELSDDELERVRAEAFEQGVAQGREAEQAALSKERQQAAALMQEMLLQWQGFRTNTAAWVEPLKRLSLAVGEQLARAHLSLHPEHVQALVLQCAEALGETRDHVLVHVHPDDLTRLQALDVRWPDDWQWVADARLGLGSVRLSTEDSEVEDLMAHRLSVLAQQLLDPHLPQVHPDHVGPDQAPTPVEASEDAASARAEAQAVLPRQAPSSMTQRAAQAQDVQDATARDSEAPPPVDAQQP